MQRGTLQRPARIHMLYGVAAVLVLGALLYLGASASPRVPARVAVSAVLERLIVMANARDLAGLLRELPATPSSRSSDTAAGALSPGAHERGPATLASVLSAAVADPGWSELRVLRRELREGLSVDVIVVEVDIALLPAGEGGLGTRLASHRGLGAVRLEFTPIGETWQVARLSASPLELRTRPPE